MTKSSRYEQAVEAFENGDFETALKLFIEYDTYDSPGPSPRFFAAICYAKLGRDKEAIVALNSIKGMYPDYDVLSKLKNNGFSDEIIAAVTAHESNAGQPLTNKDDINIALEVRKAIELMMNKGSPVIRIKGTPFTPEKTQVRHWVKKFFDGSTEAAAAAVVKTVGDDAGLTKLILADREEMAKGADSKGKIPRSGEYFGTIYNAMRRIKPELKDQRREDRQAERQERRQHAKAEARRIMVEGLHKVARSK